MITIYGKPQCGFCEQAKNLSQTQSIQYRYVEVDFGQSRQPDVEYISRDHFIMMFPEARSVPQILVDGIHIGGFTEFQNYIKEQQK